jgi:hypothetical protein
MTITQFHEWLGAPVTNVNWSWGSQRQEDGAIFLRVWNDETKKVAGAQWAMVAHHKPGGASNLGYRERIKHLERAESGFPCFLVLIDAHDPASRPGPRKILKFDARILGIGGEIKTEDDRSWMHIAGFKMVADVRLPPTSK